MVFVFVSGVTFLKIVGSDGSCSRKFIKSSHQLEHFNFQRNAHTFLLLTFDKGRYCDPQTPDDLFRFFEGESLKEHRENELNFEKRKLHPTSCRASFRWNCQNVFIANLRAWSKMKKVSCSSWAVAAMRNRPRTCLPPPKKVILWNHTVNCKQMAGGTWDWHISEDSRHFDVIYTALFRTLP